MPDRAFDTLVAEARDELTHIGQVSLFVYAKAQEQGFDINAIVTAAETLGDE